LQSKALEQKGQKTMKGKPTQQKKYRVVHFYARSHQPEFHSREAAMRHIEARALKGTAACYTELWEVSGDDGEMQALFDYGCTVPKELVQR
jgi:hypothetical protein